jgi:hypothetical protein
LLYLKPKYKIGIVLNNLGTQSKFVKEGYSLPLLLKFGISYYVRKNFVSLVDIVYDPNDTIQYHLGGEFVYNKIKDIQIMLRGGFRSDNVSYLGTIAGITVGFGVSFFNKVGFDYAYTPYNFLGTTHRIALTLYFPTTKVITKEIIKEKYPEMKEIKIERKTILPANANQIYRDALNWFKEKVEKEKIDKETQKILVKRIIEKFEPFGVDVSEAKKILEELEK